MLWDASFSSVDFMAVKFPSAVFGPEVKALRVELLMEDSLGEFRSRWLLTSSDASFSLLVLT